MKPVHILGFIAALFLAALTLNPLLSIGSLIVGFLLLKLMWNPKVPAVFLYSVGYQWLQTTVLVFWADLQAVDYLELCRTILRHSVYPEEATWLSLVGILVVAIGVRLGLRRKVNSRLAKRQTSAEVRVIPLFWVTLAAIIGAEIIPTLGSMVPGLLAASRALAIFHWGIYFYFASTVFRQKTGKWLLLIAFTIELGNGFLGYFSDFKTVLVVTFLAALSNPSLLRGGQKAVVVALCIFALTLGIVWSSIKGDYRVFLNKGTGGQVILVGMSEQVSELMQLISNLDSARLAIGIDDFLYRISYIEYFSSTIGYVPASVSYQHGKLWGEAILHVLTPRIINPNKEVINDSDRTNEYSGTRVATGQMGTSISLGYIAESYIDFGPFGMVLPLSIFGFLLGRGYSILAGSKECNPVIIGCTVALIAINASTLEMSNLKMVGALTMGFIVVYAVKIWAGDTLVRLLAFPVATLRRPARRINRA